MSRHRDVRSMNYSDEYDEYDEVYGRSVDDDISMSPGAEQFMFDRNKKQNMSSFLTESDVTMDDDNYEEPAISKRPELSELDTAKLVSCTEIIRNVIGDEIKDTILTNEIIKANFDAEIALDKILKSLNSKNSSDISASNQHPEPQSGSSKKSSFILPNPNLSNLTPKLSLAKQTNNFSSLSELMNNHKTNLVDSSATKIPEKKVFNSLSELIANHSVKKENTNENIDKKKSFGTLADLTANHMQKSNSPIAKSSSFVIPKFSLKSQNNNSNGFVKNLLITPNFLTKKNTTDNLKVLQNKLVNMEVSSKPLLTEIETLDVKNDDECIIDLSSVLKQTKTLSTVVKNTETKLPSYNLKDIFLMSAEPIPSSIVVESLEVLNCQTNAINLRYKKLNYCDKNGSMFGKMLCRRWCLNKPYVKHSKCEYTNIIKPFDFTSPSPDNIIFANLRRQ